MKFNVDAPIWLSKQRILCTLNQSLKDVLNYGLFQPAYNGKAGKFLDEERQLREYPFPSIAPVPYLEVGMDYVYVWGYKEYEQERTRGGKSVGTCHHTIHLSVSPPEKLLVAGEEIISHKNHYSYFSVFWIDSQIQHSGCGEIFLVQNWQE